MQSDYGRTMIELAAGAARVRIAPQMGAAITAFTVNGRDVLRPTPDAAIAEADVRLAACYPLVPYSNRIRDASLRFCGRDYPLARNFGAHPHAIHGIGWQRAWEVGEASQRRARLALLHDAREAAAMAWPWPFCATQTFELSDSAGRMGRSSAVLVVVLTLENRGRQTFPFGLGWHPFFPRDAATRLGFTANTVWRNDATQLPRERTALPPDRKFDPARPLGAIALDNVFAGWAGSATLDAPSRRMMTVVAADRACACLVVYAPPDADFIALEPVTHETDAFNRAAAGATHTGLRTLPPGAAFSCTMRIAATAID